MQHSLETGHAGFIERRHVGQQREARLACDGDRAQRSRLKIAKRRRQHAKGDRHVAANEIVYHRRRALVRDDRNIESRLRLEQLGGHVAAGSGR